MGGIRNLIMAISEKSKSIIHIYKYDSYSIVKYYRKCGAHIGENCRIDIRSEWYEAPLITIGNHVFIAQGVLLHTHDGGAWILRDEISNIRITGPIVIEDNCMIGANSHLLPNVRIGKNSIVGAGSVVISDVPPNSIVMGVPARVIGSVLKYRDKHVSIWNEEIKLGKQKPPDPKLDQRDYPL
jgi:acetyltransferase-like isoleucine patch superfamily enzyme